MVDAVVLAAGKSSRMDQNKLLLPFGNSSVIETVLERLQPFVRRIIIVIGYYKDRILKFKKWGNNIIFVVNKYPHLGMFSSVKEGVRKVQTERFFIILADQPHIDSFVFKKLLDAPYTDVVLPVYQAKVGHPILLSQVVKKEILRTQANETTVTLREVLRKFSPCYVEVNSDCILYDIDTISDYKKISGKI